MKEDKLKKIIDENRDWFDEEPASDRIWDNVNKRLDKNEPRMVPLKMVLQYAAAAVVVICVSIYFLIPPNNLENIADHNTPNEKEYLLASLSPEYAEVEHYYLSRIHFTMNELKGYNPDEELIQAVQDLDEEYKRLSEEINEQVNRDEIIEAMIENYRLKLYLLEQILESMKENNETEFNEYKST